MGLIEAFQLGMVDSARWLGWRKLEGTKVYKSPQVVETMPSLSEPDKIGSFRSMARARTRIKTMAAAMAILEPQKVSDIGYFDLG